MRQRLGAILTLLLAAGPLAAQVKGADDPTFGLVLEGWLAGDEANALPELAALAEEGNGAARLLLGVIDTTPQMQGRWLMSLNRDVRIDTLRSQGGLSGQNWLAVQVPDDPIAAAWVALWDGAADGQVILTFAELGEPRAARVAGQKLFSREKPVFAALVDEPGFPPSLRAMAIAEVRRSDPDRAAAVTATLDPADPQRRLLGDAAPQTDEAISAWLTANPEGDPIIAYCEVACPDEPPAQCHATALRATEGYWTLLLLGSPVEALIPSDKFNRSPKGIEVMASLMDVGSGAPACMQPAGE